MSKPVVLGQTVGYPEAYAPEILEAIPRKTNRKELGIGGTVPFLGADLWTAYELSWLNVKGKPQVAIARLIVPCETPNIVESKSLKLYLNGFSNEVVSSVDALKQTIAKDVGRVVWGQERTIGVEMIAPEDFAKQQVVGFAGQCIDRLDAECTLYTPAPELLRCVPEEDGEAPVKERLHSNLLKSNCLVTNQPDWGSVEIDYQGRQIDQERLLQYIVSFRNHNEFHEQCVERIYIDIWQRCKPQKLAVYARYTRRGGIDINPFRCSHPQPLPSLHRHARQ